LHNPYYFVYLNFPTWKFKILLGIPDTVRFSVLPVDFFESGMFSIPLLPPMWILSDQIPKKFKQFNTDELRDEEYVVPVSHDAGPFQLGNRDYSFLVLARQDDRNAVVIAIARTRYVKMTKLYQRKYLAV
jgi:hypothetical protein